MAKSEAKPTGNCVIYIRVSSEKQADSGLGASAQRSACEEYARREKLNIVAVWDDNGISGSKNIDQRPGLANALASIGPGDVLLVAKRDRLARDMLIIRLIERDLERISAKIVSAAGEGNGSEDPSDRLLRGLLDLFAEFERVQIAYRTAQAMAVLRAQGQKTGGTIPYGKRVARVVVDQENPKKKRVFLEDESFELGVIDRMMKQHALGLSQGDIAERLNADGIPSRSGGRWHGKVVRSIIRRTLDRQPEVDHEED